ncbi:helix-turn-helix domain-containing protein [Haloferacaceae archaeon DSL9]
MAEAQSEITVPSTIQSPHAKLVYLYLLTQGDATITQLQEGLGMKKIVLYSILKTLQERGLVTCTTERYGLTASR